jgi:hypothetical protein
VVQDHRAVRVAEDRLVAAAAVDDVAVELHARSLQLLARGGHVVDLEGERALADAERLAELLDLQHGDGQVAGLELDAGVERSTCWPSTKITQRP